MSCDTSNLRGDDRARRAAAWPLAHSADRDQLTFRTGAQPFLNALPVVGKTVSNIPVSMVTVIERQALSRHCLAG
jgi:hypothetical protein